MTPLTFPPGRYGRRRAVRPARRWLVPLLAVPAVAVGLVVTGLLYRTYVADSVRFQVTAFTVVADRTHAGRPATCYVRARGRDGTEVGGEEVAIPPAPASARIDHTLDTSARAVTGEVVRCVPG